MPKEIRMVVRPTPKIVSYFPEGTPHYNDIKHLIREPNLLIALICIFIPCSLVKLPEEVSEQYDGVSGLGIGECIKFRGFYYYVRAKTTL